MICNPEYCRAVLRAAKRGTGLRFSQRVTRSVEIVPFARSLLDPVPPPVVEFETKVDFGEFDGPPGPGETILTAEQVKSEEPDAWAALQQ